MAKPETLTQYYRIWDIPTRIFHWLLVVCVLCLLLTGLLTPEAWPKVHLIAGYFVAALTGLRLVWWVYGTGYSRLSTLLRNASQLGSFMPALLRLRPPHYAGHNPAGSLMILVLVSVLVALIVTGFLVEGGEEKHGLLAGVTWFSGGVIAHQLHEWLAYAFIALILVHVAGVAFETWVQRVPLVRAMFTGRLPLPAEAIGFDSIKPQIRSALIAIFALSIFASLAGMALLRLPPLGVKVVAMNALYDKECSACHAVFHSTLLPKASWATIMQGLDDHFGEDASLPSGKAAAIARFLVANAAETSDTEAANRFRTVSPQSPLYITRTPFWLWKHSGISDTIFASTQVKSKSNCLACHADAASGRFDDSAILAVPEPQGG